MKSGRYLTWFFGVAGALVTASIAFNVFADHYILRHRAGASVELVSGFERVLKPAWLMSIKPSLVFIGSSRARIAFDPTLIDPEFGVRSFNYGVSSASAYETRRYIQDVAQQPFVKTIVVALDAFTSGSAAQPYGGGFDELRLSVTAAGAPTPRRDLWLFTARYLSGGALGMHGLGVWLLGQLGPGELAADRPDVFPEYGHMTPAKFKREMTRRAERSMRMTGWQREQLHLSLAALCTSPSQVYFYFPPDNLALIAHYRANDARGFAKFKADVDQEITAHNAVCRNKVRLFDFLTDNLITRDDAAAHGKLSPYYLDPVHIRPPTGLLLLRQMLKGQGSIGTEIKTQ